MPLSTLRKLSMSLIGAAICAAAVGAPLTAFAYSGYARTPSGSTPANPVTISITDTASECGGSNIYALHLEALDSGAIDLGSIGDTNSIDWTFGGTASFTGYINPAWSVGYIEVKIADGPCAGSSMHDFHDPFQAVGSPPPPPPNFGASTTAAIQGTGILVLFQFFKQIVPIVLFVVAMLITLWFIKWATDLFK